VIVSYHCSSKLKGMPVPDRLRPIGNPVRESVRVLGIYIRGQFIMVGLMTVLYAVGFAIAHVPLWPVVAFLCGLCYLVPHFGSLIALTIVCLVSLLFDSNLKHLIAVFAAWVIIQGLEGFWLTPRILGKQLGLRPLVVFFALLIASFFFGPIGFLLTVPVLAVANVFWRYFRERSRVGPPA
jgi:predicted PurR-regulated permease PerM